MLYQMPVSFARSVISGREVAKPHLRKRTQKGANLLIAYQAPALNPLPGKASKVGTARVLQKKGGD
jgi:hypothetical protein